MPRKKLAGQDSFDRMMNSILHGDFTRAKQLGSGSLNPWESNSYDFFTGSATNPQERLKSLMNAPGYSWLENFTDSTGKQSRGGGNYWDALVNTLGSKTATPNVRNYMTSLPGGTDPAYVKDQESALDNALVWELSRRGEGGLGSGMSDPEIAQRLAERFPMFGDADRLNPLVQHRRQWFLGR